jgi:hypothetical protein
MTTTFELPVLDADNQHRMDALDSALDILFFYEDDDYDFLADESVICDLTDNFGYSVSDAHVLLIHASEVHSQRMVAGFYD